MATRPANFLTPEEYLELERKAEVKSEYFQGEMFAMAGASRRHGLIVTNLVRELSQRLKAKPCEVYSSDMRLRISQTGLYTYPDVVVACGELQFADNQKDTLLNPIVIIEVLSDSTRDYDRSEKFQQYRSLSSLREYITIAQDKCHVEQYTRQPENRWLLEETQDQSAVIRLASIDCEIPLAEAYDKVDWAAA